jgi:uncharacterized membrane protein YdjX (TVP38/TMEM64 family)
MIVEEKPKFTKAQLILRITLLVLVVAGTFLLVFNRNKIQHLEVYGYPGIFLVSLLSNATILVPLPGVMLTSAMAMVFNPFWVAIASGAGAALGELSGYLVGFSGQPMLEKSDNVKKLTAWMQNNQSWTIFLLALVPNPLFDMAGFMAGASRMPVWKFLFFCLLGKIAKMLAFAYLGAGIFSVFK